MPTIKEIAEACGFSDIYYFSRLVKRRFGLSPLRVRQSSLGTRLGV